MASDIPRTSPPSFLYSFIEWIRSQPSNVSTHQLETKLLPFWNASIARDVAPFLNRNRARVLDWLYDIRSTSIYPYPSSLSPFQFPSSYVSPLAAEYKQQTHITTCGKRYQHLISQNETRVSVSFDFSRDVYGVIGSCRLDPIEYLDSTPLFHILGYLSLANTIKFANTCQSAGYVVYRSSIANDRIWKNIIGQKSLPFIKHDFSSVRDWIRTLIKAMLKSKKPISSNINWYQAVRQIRYNIQNVDQIRYSDPNRNRKSKSHQGQLSTLHPQLHQQEQPTLLHDKANDDGNGTTIVNIVTNMHHDTSTRVATSSPTSTSTSSSSTWIRTGKVQHRPSCCCCPWCGVSLTLDMINVSSAISSMIHDDEYEIESILTWSDDTKSEPTMSKRQARALAAEKTKAMAQAKAKVRKQMTQVFETGDGLDMGCYHIICPNCVIPVAIACFCTGCLNHPTLTSKNNGSNRNNLDQKNVVHPVPTSTSTTTGDGIDHDMDIEGNEMDRGPLPFEQFRACYEADIPLFCSNCIRKCDSCNSVIPPHRDTRTSSSNSKTIDPWKCDNEKNCKLLICEECRTEENDRLYCIVCAPKCYATDCEEYHELYTCECSNKFCDKHSTWVPGDDACCVQCRDS